MRRAGSKLAFGVSVLQTESDSEQPRWPGYRNDWYRNGPLPLARSPADLPLPRSSRFDLIGFLPAEVQEAFERASVTAAVRLGTDDLSEGG